MALSNCENQSKGVVQLQKDNIKRASEIHEIIIVYRKCCSNQVLNVDRELRPYQYSLVKKKNLLPLHFYFCEGHNVNSLDSKGKDSRCQTPKRKNITPVKSEL